MHKCSCCCLQLTGTLPNDLELPPGLQELWLCSNNLLGPLPTELVLPASLINLVRKERRQCEILTTSLRHCAWVCVPLAFGGHMFLCRGSAVSGGRCGASLWVLREGCARGGASWLGNSCYLCMQAALPWVYKV